MADGNACWTALAYSPWSLMDQMRDGTYAVGGYDKLWIRDPKLRGIQALSFADRVAQHCLRDNILAPYFELRLIYDNAACGVRHHVRYMDDGVLLRQSKEYLREEFAAGEKSLDDTNLSIASYNGRLGHGDTYKLRKKVMGSYVPRRPREGRRVRVRGYTSCMNNEEVASMMYPFMTFNDDTEITHPETLPDGRVRVYIETPDERGGFRSATCWLPDYRWEGVCGYTTYSVARLSWSGKYVLGSSLGP